MSTIWGVVKAPARAWLVRALAVGLVFLATAITAGPLEAQPGFFKTFQPDTIGPGSLSTLVFTISNAEMPSPATDLAFTDNLPAGVTIATPAGAATSCGGTVDAPDGGSTITFSGGSVGANTDCTVSVLVTSAMVGAHINTSGDLTSSAGNSGTATGTLTVAVDRPGFSKDFSPASINLGSRSTLTFTLDNTANASLVFNVAFTDVLPGGIEIADPANASTTCSAGTVVAPPGGNTVAFSGGLISAGASCTVSLEVVGTGPGVLTNVSGELSSSTGGPTRSSGQAAATLDVSTGTVGLTKEFTDDPVNAGSSVTLEFTLTNRSRTLSATGVTFTDDLDATLSGLVATGLPLSNVCGAGSQISGTSLLTLTGGTLAPEESCTFSVTLDVPAGAVAGGYPNTTSTLTGDLGGSPFTSSAASDTLFVNDAPVLTKTFLTNPVGAGDTVTVELTITNPSATSPATAIAFNDNLDAFLTSIAVSSLPPVGSCGAGSLFAAAIINSDLTLIVSNASLPAGGSCTFDVDLTVPAGQPPGDYVNTTEPISGLVDGTVQTGHSATDTLTVVGAPDLFKSFTDDPVLPGGTVTLELTISQPDTAVADATDIAFTDDLNAAAGLSGVTAIGLPMMDVCGTGSQISGTTTLTFTGGTLAPGASCTFSVTLQVPAAQLPGNFNNATSNVTATVSGVAVTGSPAGDTLQVAGLTLTKSFTDDPAIPGGTVTLEFTLTNLSPVSDADTISFTDSLSAALSGLTATGLPMMDVCGTGSQITGTTTLILTGGAVPAGTSCTFPVTLQVPAAAAPGTYNNTTSNLTAQFAGSPVVLPPANDALEVSSSLLLLTKTFTDDPVSPGGTVTLEFTLTNSSAAATVTGIGFTDDLDAALSGLVATGLPMMDVCGTGSQIAGTGVLTLTGGSLGPGASCTFSVTLQVPSGVGLDTQAINTTSGVTGSAGGLPVTGDPASDTLAINFLTFSKAFASEVFPGGIATLSFTIGNVSASSSANGVSFLDDLSAVLPGLVATGLPMSDVCGAGSLLTGTSILNLTGGSLSAGGSCTFAVDVQVPAAAAAGTFPNTTTDLFLAGLSAAAPATADLTVEPPPTFAKAFNPAAIPAGGVSTLTFTVNNTASTLAAGNLAFTDNLPAGLVVATPSGASTACGGTLTAVSGTSVISLTGGTVSAGMSCIVQVDVTAASGGLYSNTTGDLTSDAGSSGMANADLSVLSEVGIAKTFLSAPVLPGGSVDLEFTITNSSPSFALTGITFTDDLDAVVPGLVAVGLPANDVCGTGSQITGTSVVTLTGGNLASGASCVFTVTVTLPADAPAGTFANTTGNIDAMLAGNPVSGPPATADLEVALPTFTKSFDSGGNPGDTVGLTFMISNPDPANGMDAIAFTDDLDAVVSGLTAVDTPLTDPCGTGSQLTGTSLLTLTGGNLGPGASCTFTVMVQIPSSAPNGSFANVTSALTAMVGGTPIQGDPGGASALLGVGNILVIPTLHPAALALLALLLGTLGFVVLRRSRLARAGRRG